MVLKSDRIAALEARIKNDVAHDVAVIEILRLLLSEICYRQDPVEFREVLSRVEGILIDRLASRTMWPNASEQDNTYIKEAASRYITEMIASVSHPGDNAARSSRPLQ